MTLAVSGAMQTDDRMVVLTFKARKFSPVRTIDLKKLGDVTTLPKEMQTFLSQRFVPEGTLDNEKRIEQEARAWLDASALNLGNGLHLLNPAQAVEAAVKFEQLKADYMKAKSETISDYDKSLSMSETKLRDAFPGYAGMDALIDAVRKQVPSKRELELGMSFDYQLMAMSKFTSNFDPSKDPLLSKGFLELEWGMFGRLIGDVCSKAKDLHEDLVEKRAAADGRIKEKTFNRALAIANKVTVMSFINPAKAGAMSKLITEALAQFPKKFPWDESNFAPFCDLVSRLASQAHVVKCIDTGAPLFTITAPVIVSAPAVAVAAPVTVPAPAVAAPAPVVVQVASVAEVQSAPMPTPPVIPAPKPANMAGLLSF